MRDFQCGLRLLDPIIYIQYGIKSQIYKKKKHMFWISAVDNADLKEVTVIQRHPNNVLQTT